MVACFSIISSSLSTSIHPGLAVGADVVMTSPVDISENGHLNGQKVHSTSLDILGGSSIVPHCGQKGQLDDECF